MIDPKEKIKQELSEYLNLEEHLNREDKLKVLNAIIEKHFIYDRALHLITENDILTIAGMKNTAYSQLSLPLYVGSRQMGYDDLRTIAGVEAFITYMNLNYLSRKEMKINYKKG